MQQSGVQAKINRGLGRAARTLGAPFTIRRPAAALDPLAAAPLGTLLAKLDQDFGFRHRRPADHGKPLYYLLADATDLRPGDYLTGAEGTWFIAAMEPNVPPLCVRCNAVMDLLRSEGAADPDLTPGLHDYAGTEDATNTVLLRGWPASLLQGGVTAANPVNLPGDGRQAGKVLLMPAWPGVVLQAGDLARDDTGARYVLAGVETTALGLRCPLSLAAT